MWKLLRLPPRSKLFRVASCAQCSRPRHAGGCPSLCTVHDCHLGCINCQGPYKVDYIECPARPSRVHGVFIRLKSRQIRAVRTAGKISRTQARAILQTTDTFSPSENPAKVTESRTENMEIINIEDEVQISKLWRPSFPTGKSWTLWTCTCYCPQRRLRRKSRFCRYTRTMVPQEPKLPSNLVAPFFSYISSETSRYIPS